MPAMVKKNAAVSTNSKNSTDSKKSNVSKKNTNSKKNATKTKTVKQNNKTAKSTTKTSSKKASSKETIEMPLTQINKSSIRRLAQRGLVKRMKVDVFPHVRERIRTTLEHVLDVAIKTTVYHGRTTLSSNDIYSAFRILGCPIIAGIDKDATNVFKTCSSSRKKKVGKTRRSKTGTEAKRDIAFQVKNSEWFAIPRANFVRLARSIVKNHPLTQGEKYRFDRNCIDLAQLAIENMIISLFSHANMISAHDSSRKTVKKEDIMLCEKICNSPLI